MFELPGNVPPRSTAVDRAGENIVVRVDSVDVVVSSVNLLQFSRHMDPGSVAGLLALEDIVVHVDPPYVPVA